MSKTARLEIVLKAFHFGSSYSEYFILQILVPDAPSGTEFGAPHGALW